MSSDSMHGIHPLTVEFQAASHTSYVADPETDQGATRKQ